MKLVFKIILVVILIAYACIVFDFALNGYPGFIQDSTCFLPTAYFINHFHQLINPLYDAGLDPVQHRVLFYPPLFPYVIAWINSTIPNFFNNMYVSQTVIDLSSTIVLLISIRVYLLKQNVSSSTKLYLFSILWLVALFSFYGIQEGRPEVLCKFFLSCFILNNVYKSKSFCNLNNGVIVCLNLITSPVSTFYLMLITLCLMIYNNEFKIKPIIITLLGFGIVLGCFTIVYPYHVMELVKGLQQHSKNVISNRYSTNSLKTFISFYITYTYAPLLIINFLIAVFYTGYIVLKKDKIISFTLLIILSCLVSYFSFKDMPMNYNMLVLSPIFFFILFVLFFKIINTSKKNTYLNGISVTIVFVLFVNSVGFVRKTLLFYSTKDKKVSYVDFRNEFIKTLRLTDKNKKVGITFSLWPYCLDQYQHITLNKTDTTIQYLMLQQSYTGSTEPLPEPNFKLIKNNFITDHPKLGKLPLGNIYPWYQTATYERK